MDGSINPFLWGRGGKVVVGGCCGVLGTYLPREPLAPPMVSDRVRPLSKLWWSWLELLLWLSPHVNWFQLCLVVALFDWYLHLVWVALGLPHNVYPLCLLG